MIGVRGFVQMDNFIVRMDNGGGIACGLEGSLLALTGDESAPIESHLTPHGSLSPSQRILLRGNSKLSRSQQNDLPSQRSRSRFR